ARETRPRAIIVGSGLLAVIVPAILGWLHVLPTSYTFERGMLIIQSQVFGLLELPTMLFLLIISLQIVITACIIVARQQNLLAGAEERMLVQAWQLRQLMPEETAAAMPSVAPDGKAAV